MNPATEPRANHDSAEIRRKQALLEHPHVAPLTAFVRRLRAEHPDVPWFDPTEAGVEAPILFLMKTPSGGAAVGAASGFVSPDNDDRTAERFWNLLHDLGVVRSREVVTWNIVPWPTPDDRVHAADLDAAAPALRELLGLLPRLRAVIPFGAVAAGVGVARA